MEMLILTVDKENFLGTQGQAVRRQAGKVLSSFHFRAPYACLQACVYGPNNGNFCPWNRRHQSFLNRKMTAVEILWCEVILFWLMAVFLTLDRCNNDLTSVGPAAPYLHLL